MSRRRVGVIGAGAWGRNQGRTVASVQDVDLMAVCDLSAAVPDRAARAYPGIRVTDSAQALLQQADAAPMVEDAVELAEGSDRLKAPALVGHLPEFHPVVDRL